MTMTSSPLSHDLRVLARRPARSTVIGHALSAAAVLAAFAGVAGAQDWEFFPTTSPYPDTKLFAVDAVAGAPADAQAWAVGNATFFGPGGTRESALATMRFDGSAWIFEPAPELGDTGPSLWGVATLPGGDAIAVGAYSPISVGQTLTLRYDGGAWTQVDGPTFTGGSAFSGMGRAGEDIWAGGLRRSLEPPPAAANTAIAARWIGGGGGDNWEVFDAEPLATLGGRSINDIRAIDGVAEDDAWGVGAAQQTGPTDPFGPTPYIVRWRGGDRWELVDVGIRAFGNLAGVEAIASDDVWAVGSINEGTDGSQPLILHFDGTGWTRQDVPVFADGRAELRAIAARSATEIYAGGTNADASGRPRPLMLRYDGTGWTEVDVADTDGRDEWFRAMTVNPKGDVWAVGQYYRPGDDTQRGLVQRLPATTCRADVDGDGALTIFDFLAFQNRFDAGDPIADFDGDGELTLFDFLAFQNAFDAGCA